LRTSNASQIVGFSTEKARLMLMLLVVALLPVSVWWIERAVDAPEHGWFEGTSTFALGSDIAIFHAAGVVVADGHGRDLYEPNVFQAAMREDGFLEPVPGMAFAGHPPTFALPFVPLAPLSVEGAWVAVALVNLLSLAAALRLMRLRIPWLVFAALLSTLPAYFAVTFGQPTMVYVLLMACVYRAIERGAWLGAGAALGTLGMLKPTLAIGTLLWFAIDPEHRRAAYAAMGTAVTWLVVTLPVLGTAWLGYPDGLTEFTRRHAGADEQWAQFSSLGLVQALLPSGPLTWLGYAAVLVAGVVAFRLVMSRSTDRHVHLAASVLLTLWIAPQLVAYDWMLVVVAGAALWHAWPERRRKIMLVGALLALVAPWSVIIGNAIRPRLGVTLQLGVAALAVVGWLFTRETLPRSVEPVPG
jgi:Glycosyltransferase family 87